MKFKPPPQFDQGLFLDLDDQPYEASLVGQMIPQPDVIVDGNTCKLDALLGNGFALIAQDQAGADAIAGLSTDRLAGLPLARIVLATGESLQSGLPVAIPTDTRSKPLRTHRDQLLLMRPDRYCAAAFAPDEMDTALGAFEKLLGLPWR